MPSSKQETKPTAAELKAIERAKVRAAKERKALAQKILKLREDGVKWDGENGIVDQGLVSSAIQGRKLLKEIGQQQLIGPSYDREEAKAKREAEAAA